MQGQRYYDSSRRCRGLMLVGMRPEFILLSDCLEEAERATLSLDPVTRTEAQLATRVTRMYLANSENNDVHPFAVHYPDADAGQDRQAGRVHWLAAHMSAAATRQAALVHELPAVSNLTPLERLAADLTQLQMLGHIVL